MKGSSNATTTEISSAQRSRVHKSVSGAFFQRAIGPMPIRNTSIDISGTNTVSKYGGPTEIFPSPSASRNSGYSVPRNTDAAATASTDVSTPERTRNVPIRLNENAQIASNTVHALKVPRFSVTASEWINAVPTSQGMNEAFSTGSQNHQPP